MAKRGKRWINLGKHADINYFCYTDVSASWQDEANPLFLLAALVR